MESCYKGFILYKQCNHNLYIGIIISPHIGNTQSTSYNSICSSILAPAHHPEVGNFIVGPAT